MRPGERVGDRYDLEHVLGGGELGEVWSAIDRVHERQVALRIIHQRHRRTKARSKFRQDVQQLMMLEHPGIARTLDYKYEDDLAYIAMELVAGETLADVMPMLELNKRMVMFEQICAAVHYAHRAAITHHDLKPANIRVVNVATKILDFGTARLKVAPGSDAATMQIGGGSYRAPEQLKSKPADHRADIFALGVLLFELLTSRRLWLVGPDGRPLAFGRGSDLGDNSARAVVDRILRGPRPGVTTYRPELPAAVDQVIRMALAPDPAARPASVLELTQRLASALVPSRASVAPDVAIAFGSYALLKLLGRGATGDVCLARNTDPKRPMPTPIVIKRLSPELAEHPDFVSRFRHEAEVAARIDSPYVARVYDVGEVDDTLYIAMEHVDGWPLFELIEALLGVGRHASIATVVALMWGGLEGLAALHGAKDPRTKKPLRIVHRDISPKNLMVDVEGKMHVIDLGLGKSSIQRWKTSFGTVMGSPGYMAPEQAQGEAVDQRADVYAMAASMFELLTLRYYIPRGPIPEMQKASLKPKFEPPSMYRSDVPKALDDVLKKALSPDPRDRHQDGAALLAAIEEIVPPDTASAAACVRGLFGQQLPVRARELARLLRMPLPQNAG